MLVSIEEIWKSTKPTKASGKGKKKPKTKPKRPGLIEILTNLVNENFVPIPHRWHSTSLLTSTPQKNSKDAIWRVCTTRVPRGRGLVSSCQKALCAHSHLHRVYKKTITDPEKPWEHSDIQQMGGKGVKTRVQSNGKMIWTSEAGSLSLHLSRALILSAHWCPGGCILSPRTAEEQ